MFCRGRAKRRVALAAVLTTLGLGVAVAGPGSAFAGCAGSNEASPSLSKGKARDAIACLFNKERSAQNVKPDRDLEQAAQSHTSTMRKQGCFLHQCPGELSLTARVKRAGYSSSPYVGEVIVSYPRQATPRDVVSAWMSSAPHREEILRRSFKDVGVGISVRGSNVLYTAVLGHK